MKRSKRIAHHYAAQPIFNVLRSHLIGCSALAQSGHSVPRFGADVFRAVRSQTVTRATGRVDRFGTPLQRSLSGFLQHNSERLFLV